MPAFTDHFGRPINVGDTVQVDCIDASRGAQQWMHRGTVVGFGRTRVKIEFSSATGVYNVGPECMAVIRDSNA